MVTNIVSAVIVQNEHGYLATVRFRDSLHDECIAAETRWGIYERVERLLRRRCHEELNGGW